MKIAHCLSTGLLLVLSLLYPLPLSAQPLTFTAIPDEDESRLLTRFQKVADYLAHETGLDVRYLPVKSYAAAVTAFRNNQVQLAWFGGLSGVQARMRVPESRAIAQGYEDQFFKTYFIANTATGLKYQREFPANIKGHTFTFGSKGSTSGRLMPEFHIREHLGPPSNVFSRVGFSGDHSHTIALVQSGAYALGAVNYKVWENEWNSGRIDPSKIRIIWETPDYPDYQCTIRGDVDRQFGNDTTLKIRNALLGMTDTSLLRQRFVHADNSDFEPILSTARQIGLID